MPAIRPSTAARFAPSAASGPRLAEGQRRRIAAGDGEYRRHDWTVRRGVPCGSGSSTMSSSNSSGIRWTAWLTTAPLDLGIFSTISAPTSNLIGTTEPGSGVTSASTETTNPGTAEPWATRWNCSPGSPRVAPSSPPEPSISAATNPTASKRFDLPLALGPTSARKGGTSRSKLKKDLNPSISIRVIMPPFSLSPVAPSP